MTAVGTEDLAQALVDFMTRVADDKGRSALYVFDVSGRRLVSGGCMAADASFETRIDTERCEVVGLLTTRQCAVRAVHLREAVVLWVIVTDDARQSRDAVQGLADLVGGMLERERMRDYEAEDTTEHLLTCFEQIRSMHDLSDRLPTCETVEAMVELCLGSLITALGVRSSAFIQRARDFAPGRVLRIAAGDAELQVTDYQSTPGPVADALADAKVRYGAISSYEVTALSLEAEAQQALMVVPVCFGQESDAVLGALVLLDREDGLPGRAFGSPDADLAQSVGTLLGLALGTRERAAAEKELQIARTIQETLIPAHAPSWAALDVAGRNRSANQVGGDYFDFVESPGGAQHCVIADVSGHNMASAMAMVMARSQLRSILRREASPASALQDLCRGLHEDLVRNELFITAFFLTVLERDAERGARMRFANAGHNPPLVLRKDGSIEWLHGGGPMIGFLPEISYDESELWLAEGDLLVLYTDGVTEATNAKGQMLDEDGLARVVEGLQHASASDILDGIYHRVEAHSGHRVADDDVTVVVIKCRVQQPEGRPALAGAVSTQ